MSWAAYCNFPSATSSCIAGIDGKASWGVKGDWKASGPELAKLAKAGPGSMVAVGGQKYMIVTKAADCWFGAAADTCLVIKHMKKVFLAGVASKDKKDKLIDEINKFAASLEKGGY
ncbi:hypothetical protein AAMO2058_000706500 [Amorphochlora amoebiformis]|eukprot:92889-Amorphochlora_amoeboformis.AAC.3